MNTPWLIFIVMLVSGALGGVMNFFITDLQEEQKMPWWQHSIVGIGAAFMVPLFLNMISGNLIDEVLGSKDNEPNYSKLFVLAGFCLVAAVSARAFISSLSRRVLQEVRSAKATAEEAKEDAAEAKAVVAPFVEEEVAANQEPTAKDDVELANDERAALRAMTSSGYSMRSITGIAKDSRLEKTQINQTISSLMSKGLVVQVTNPRNELRWYPTNLGRSAAAKLPETEVGLVK